MSACDLRVTSAGPTNEEGEYEIAVAYGARSFTIWDQNGVVVYDQIERITAAIYGNSFNSTDDENASETDYRRYCWCQDVFRWFRAHGRYYGL